MTYTLLIKKSARKQLGKIPGKDQERIIAAIRLLAHDPRPAGSKKLTGREAWRIRSGRYRIIYEIHDERIEIFVISIGHRREIYRS